MARGIRIFINTEQMGAALIRSMNRRADAVRAATRATAAEVATKIETEGRADISAAGNFGTRWTQGFHAKVTEGGGNIRVAVTHDVPYWTVFQHGKVIVGKPLLWIPLSFAEDAQGVRAGDYSGQLFRVNRVGKAPLLLTPPGIPKYFGKESVTIPKKFHLIEIAKRAAKQMRSIYRSNLKKG